MLLLAATDEVDDDPKSTASYRLPGNWPAFAPYAVQIDCVPVSTVAGVCGT